MTLRIDLIAPLDAAFDVQSDETTWLERVARALCAVVDDGCGTIAWTMSTNPSAPAFDVIAADDAPLDPKDLFAMHADATPEELELSYAFTASGPVHSLATALGERRFQESRTIRRFLRPRRISDAACLRIQLGRRLFVVGAQLREVAAIPPVMRRHGHALALRIQRAHRLRATIAEQAPVAISTPDAKVVHAERDARGNDALETLRRSIAAREEARGPLRHDDPAAAFALFDGLASGRYTLVDRFERDGRRYVVAYENEPDVARLRALTAREREILLRAAQGQPVKRIAVELGITPNAAGAYLASARKKTGVRSREELARWFGLRPEARG